MEPVTHFLTGACIGRAGLNRKTAYATLAAVLAAEAADIDILWGVRGPVEELKHHRGITHTFIAVPVVAAVVVGLVWAIDGCVQARRGRRNRAAQSNGADAISAGALEEDPSGAKAHGIFARLMYTLKPVPFTLKPVPFTLKPVPFTLKPVPPTLQTASDPPAGLTRSSQPVNWGWLYLTALISALCHLLLDWTNNYGLRPFFPFNDRWYAGSFVFIAEPVLWALLLAALVIPWLLGLADTEIGAKKMKFRGRGWAIFALAGMVLVWGWRWSEHGRARALMENTPIATAPVKRMAFEPYPIDPFRWHVILETDAYYQTAEINTRTGEIVSDPRTDVIYKPRETAATEAAKRTLLGQVYLDWGRWAVVRDVGPEPIPGPVPGLAPPQLPPKRAWTTVQFTDLRFDYSYLDLGMNAERAPSRSPLTGWVYIVDGRDEAGEAMSGREQR